MHTDLDAADVRILQLLQHDARMTTKEIADKLGLSATPVYERVRRLENEGYILGYVALLNKDKIDRNLIGYTTVQLKEHSQQVLRSFEKEVIKFHEVMECSQLTGQADFLLKVVIRDMEAYHDFLMNKLSTLPNIGVVQTSFVLAQAKDDTAYHLEVKTAEKRRRKNG